MYRSGGQIIVDQLVREGVEYVAGIPGHGCLSIFDALRESEAKGDIKYIQVKQEMSAVHMADAYYRVSGKPLATFTSIGPGALNTVIGIGTAYVDSIPLLVLMGDAHTHMRGAGILQEIERKYDSDILSVFRPITKRCWRVEDIRQLPKIMRRAFQVMMTGRKGPVVISIPMDIQAEWLDIDIMSVKKANYETLAYGAKDSIDNAFELIKNAKRPIILAGGGMLYSRAHEELKALAEIWGAAVITTMAGKGSFPEDHHLYGWHGGSKGTGLGNYLCRTADLVLALGCRFADETTSSYRKGITYNFPETKLIHVDIDASEIGKNYIPDVGIVGDVKAVLTQFIEKFNEEDFNISYLNTEYFKDIQNAKKEWNKELKEISNDQKDAGLTISGFIQTLNDIFPEEGIIVTSSGNAQAQVLQEYCFTKPSTHVTTGGFSTMGFTLPAAIGAKLARPEVPVMALAGDGDFLMTMQELSTAAQYNNKIIVVVLNNGGWMAIRDLQIDVFGREYDFGNDFMTSDGNYYLPNLSEIARIFGFFSQKVTKKNEVENAIKSALNSDRPSFIEVMVNREYPHSGGISTGWWDVPVPHYIKTAEEYQKSAEEEFIV